MSSAVDIVRPELSEADEMEGAWSVLSSNASEDGTVRKPVHILTQHGWNPSKVRDLLRRMERRRWIELGGGKFYHLRLVRSDKTLPRSISPIVPIPKKTVPASPPAPKESAAPAKNEALTQEEVDAELYGGLLHKLICRSFQQALDGYISLTAYRALAKQEGHAWEPTLAVLVERAYCSIWVIRPGGLEEAALSSMDERATFVCVEHIPVPRPSKGRKGGDDEEYRSASRSYSYDPPPCSPVSCVMSGALKICRGGIRSVDGTNSSSIRL